MKKFSFLLFFSFILSSCGIFHLFSPAVQNQINKMAELKGFVKIGDTLCSSNSYMYEGSVQFFDIDVDGTPYILYYDTNGYYDVVKFASETTIVSRIYMGFSYSSEVFRVYNGTPYFAFVDSTNYGDILNLSGNVYSPIGSGYFSADVTEFDYMITSDGKHVVVYKRQSDSYNYITSAMDTGGWGQFGAFPSAGFIQSNCSAKIEESIQNAVYVMLNNDYTNELAYINPSFRGEVVPGYYTDFSVSKYNIYYSFQPATAEMRIFVAKAPLNSPGFVTNSAYEVNYFPNLLSQSIVASKSDPERAFCIIDFNSSDTNAVIEILPNMSFRTMSFPVSNVNYLYTDVYCGYDGSIYFTMDYVKTDTGGTNFYYFDVYRYYPED